MEASEVEPVTIQKKVWLTYPKTDLVRQPLLWRMSRAFPGVSFDIRQASVSDHIGIMAVLLEGTEDEIHEAILFLKNAGVVVEPIEKTVIEG
jgi:hypothetical protein